MSDDVLKNYPVDQVHRWYTRLANFFLAKKIKGKIPLSGQFLKTYVTNRVKDKEYTFATPDYLQNYVKVKEALLFHRQVFLTEEKARLGKNGATRKWAGLIPRLQDRRWDGTSEISLYYQTLVEVGGSLAEVIHIQMSGTSEERDLFTSLRGFQLRSDIEVTGTKKGGLVTVMFKKWLASGYDRYDFNYKEHLTLPNPDYQSKDKDAIRPDLKSFRVYHSNAKRMVDKGLAAPFKVKLNVWNVTSTKVIGSASINSKKQLR